MGFFFTAESESEFLLTEDGSPFRAVFSGLRLTSLIGHPQDVDMVQGDRIVPTSKLLPVFRIQWYRMLRADQGIDKGYVISLRFSLTEGVATKSNLVLRLPKRLRPSTRLNTRL